METLAISGVGKVYPDGTCALRGLDLRLERGLFGLLGPNGAGKTTLLSILALRQEATAGHFVMGELDSRAVRCHGAMRAGIGYLPQEFAPCRHLTAVEYLVHCMRLRGLRLGRARAERRALDLLAAVGLDHVARRQAHQYSGGMMRRLGLAQAVAHNPRLLIADEPTAGLDPEERSRIRSFFAAVAREATVILSTHIVEDVAATASRVGVIAGGRLLFDGPPGELLRRAGASGAEAAAEIASAADLENAYADLVAGAATTAEVP